MTDALPVVFLRRAIREVDAADEWWRANRDAAPELFTNELERALAALARVPKLGAAAKGTTLPGVRRVLLRKTNYFVYYRIRDAIEVLAVWHASRSPEPNL